MENSLNSSSPETTVSVLKSVFNKPSNVSHAFEVTMDESIRTTVSNKSDHDVETTSSEVNKLLPFKRTRESNQQVFNVTLDDSNLNSEDEQSVTFAKPLPVFVKKKKSLNDFFNVSYNESDGSLQVNNISKSVDESNIFNKTNPFKRIESVDELSVGGESTMQVSQNENRSGLQLERSEFTCGIEEADSTTLVTKQNPFKNSDKQESSTQLEVSITEGDKTAEADNGIMTDSKINDEEDSDLVTKSNPFEHKESLGNSNSISVTDEQSQINTEENAVFHEPNLTPKNISIDRSISKEANKSTSYLEQSSVNDENLNHWMSDQSDEEMPPPRIPSVTTNLSHTKENPPVLDSPTVETNPVSVWEQKLSEIILNADRKSKVLKVNSSQKAKPVKKLDQHVKKPVENDNKYKPPKLLKPAPFATKKLYNYIIKRLEPKYGIDTILESENLVMSICDTVKKVTRRKTYQKKLIQNLKKEMAKAGLIETTIDFHEFIIKFLPYSFRVKVVPCVQPMSNVVYPPKDEMDPFDKILKL